MKVKKKAIWREIFETLSDEIREGLYQGQTGLPSENALAERFSVTRMTIRKSLSLLQQQGVVYSVHGKGFYVKKRLKQYRIRGNQRFISGLEAADADIDTKTLSLKMLPAPLTIANELKLRKHTPVWQLTRLRSINEHPVFLNRKYFPADIFPDFETFYYENQSVISVYEGYGINHYQRSETRVRVGFLCEEDAILLKQSSATPSLLTSSLNTTEDGTLIEFSTGCWLHDAIELVFYNEE